MKLFIIGLMIGIGFGYYWSYKAYHNTYQIELAKKDATITHYRQNWTPIRDVPIRKRIK